MCIKPLGELAVRFMRVAKTSSPKAYLSFTIELLLCKKKKKNV